MIIDGKQIKEKYLNKIKEEITSKKITLAVIQVGNDEASSVYVKQKEKMCAQIGANFNHYTFDETTSEEEIINLINKLNKDETTGILVQLPLPPKFNKDKIMAFAVACTTVFVLFLMTSMFAKTPTKTIETANLKKQLPIYSVKTEEAKVSLTINCAWNAEDIDKILETLEQQQVKVTFFMVGDWIDKYPEAVKKINEAGQEIRKP